MKPFISLDWGTTSFRAYELGADGSIKNQVAAADGITAVKDGAFEQTLENHIGAWDKSLPIVASGMITSRQGWVECAYAECPASASDLAKSITRQNTNSGRAVHFITGLHYNSPTIKHDVLRGEETQVFGSLASGATQFITPGTHSKWISVTDGHIDDFATYMTGETFALYRNHSILGRLMKDGPHDEGAFTRGFAQSVQSSNDMLHHLFSVRTFGLFNELPPEKLASYLSGLLIGFEIGNAIDGHGRNEKYMVLGSPSLASNYITALRLAGLNVKLGNALCGIEGQRIIAHQAGII
jgi:2-dehydro-3-deoxygalactonokinase